MKTGVTKANANRKIRQDALREQLKAQGHEQHALEIVKKLTNPDHELDQLMVQRFKIALDGHFKFLNKYIPDLRSVELEGSIDITEHAGLPEVGDRVGELLSIGTDRHSESPVTH